MKKAEIGTIFLILVSLAVASFAGNLPEKPRRDQPYKTAGTPSATIVNINNITSWVQADAVFPPNVAASWNGEFPKGSGVGVIYQEGIIFGGFVSDGTSPALRVGGTEYSTGMQAGKILTGASGNVTGAEDPTSADVRIWRVRVDVWPGQTTVPDLTVDAATFFQVPSNQVTAAQIQQIQQQYYSDWQQWPAAKGAPWYIDSVGRVRNDAAYDPTNAHDIPGIPGAAQAIWFVCNDLNPALTSSLYGSPPIGIEEQMTLWAYSSSSQLNNIIFKQIKLIYKGTTTSAASSEIDSMYVVQWRDPDIGDFSDDFAGCDSTLSLGYCYNGNPTDSKYAAIGYPPPASGACLLEGPAHHTGNSSDSVQVNFQWRHGYAYWLSMPMTSYLAFLTGTTMSDPDLGSYSGTLQFFNLMRGDLPRPSYPAGVPFCQAFPYAIQNGLCSPYVLNGDPVTGIGWIDGLDVTAGDRRDLSICGPFTLKLHDTAEVVVAMIGAMGADYLSSVTELRQSAVLAHNLFNSLFKASPPSMTVAVDHGTSNAKLSIVADGRGEGFASMTASLKHHNGSTLASVRLYDDGMHGDGTAGDGVFADTVTVPIQPDGLHLDLSATGNFGAANWNDVADNITTNGPITLTSVEIEQDNLNQDGRANPGEVVRVSLGLTNNGLFPATLVRLRPSGELNGKGITVDAVPAKSTFQQVYSATDENTFFSFQIPSSSQDSIFESVLAMMDTTGNVWQDTIRIPVYPLSFPLHTAMVQHVSGKADGSFTIRIVRPDSVKNHTYIIMGVNSIDSIGSKGLSVKDSTTGAFILINHALPDKLGDNMPVTDGFIIAGTTVDSGQGMRTWNVPSGVRWWTWTNANSFGLEGFDGAMGMAYNQWFSSSTVTPANLHNVLFRFATTDSLGNIANPSDGNITTAYRYLRHASSSPAEPSFSPFIVNPGAGYAYQDRRPVPIAAYDEENNNQRLDIGFLENNVTGGMVDGKYWPPLYSDGIDNVNTSREWLFVFGTAYNGTVDNPSLKADILDNTVPMMWMITANRNVASLDSTDQFEILAYHSLTSEDTWSFNPTVLTGIKQTQLPAKFELRQNYPNPFNPTTAIQFSIPSPAHVSLRIYNILGQEIATIVSAEMKPGTYTSYWNGRNRYDMPAATGVYFCRIEAGNFVNTIKMLLLK